MFKNILVLGAAALLVTACSTDGDNVIDADDPIAIETREGISEGPLESETLFGENTDQFGPEPGTQADLVVNVGDRIFFGYDRHDLSGEARDILNKQAQWLRQYSNLSITVEGHADERGTREYNLALGERRANSVKNFLVALGVSPSRITTISFGKERPAVPGSNETSWAQNRRGVTVVE